MPADGYVDVIVVAVFSNMKIKSKFVDKLNHMLATVFSLRCTNVSSCRKVSLPNT